MKRVTKVSSDDVDEGEKLKSLQGSVALSRHLINVREILTWSNATPIRNQTDLGYLCCYCNESYQKPADLKQHTLKNHEGIENSSFTKRRDLNAFYVKVDITGLRCRICDTNLDCLDDLIVHLVDIHKKRLFTDINNQILCFKFETENIKCFICSAQFHRFKAILEHMNVHCRNFVCGVCDRSFVNKKRLRSHEREHKVGIFQCEICSEEFPTPMKRKLHIVAVHKPFKFRNRCGYCNEMFGDYNHKLNHLRNVHKVKDLPSYNCKACDRTFTNAKALRAHVQRDHLLHRPFSCTECDKNFFNAFGLRVHMLKHNGLREFKCDLCQKSYGRKSTLRDHMRIHIDDKRFKCAHCGHRFVQKCSWRGHMRSKHGEEV